MRRSILLVVVGLSVAAEPRRDASERPAVVEFLKKHVIGKTLASGPLTTATDQGRIEGVYEDQSYFSNLVETVDGFSFDQTMVTKETLYDLDPDKKRILPGRRLHGVRVYRYEMVERKSTGKLVGFARFVSSTVKDDPFSGTFFLARMNMVDGALIVVESQAGYADFVAAKGTYKPVATDGRSRYFVKDGKLELHYDQTTVDVNPETLQRTPTKDKFPTQISKEIVQK